MNLTELYQQTPVAQHGQIKVLAEKVIVVGQDGSIDQYLRLPMDELLLVSSDKTAGKLLDKIAKKLGVT